MLNTANDFNIKEENSLEQNRHLQKLLFRILPYWPFVLLLLLLGTLASKLYLRYTTKVYAVKARIIVNDDAQQKSANLIDIVQLDTRNLSSETEKEMEILQSRNLLSDLAKKLQLNIHYGSKGYIKSGEVYKNLPFTLEIKYPDSLEKPFSGEIEIVNHQIKFNNVLYPADTFVKSDYGEIKWHINSKNINVNKSENWYITVQTLYNTVSELQNSLIIEPISQQSSILDITYKDALPERGLDILVNLLALYNSSSVEYKSRISENTLKFLNERLDIVSGELNGIEKKLQNYKTSNDIIDLSTQGQVVLKQLNETDTKISALDVQMDVLNKIKEYVEKRNNTNDPVPATLGISDPILNGLLTQLFQTEFELQKLKQTSGSKNPKIAVLQENIDKLKPSILESIGNLKAAINVSKQQLQSDNDKLNGKINMMPVKERQLLDINREQGIKNGIYTFLLQKKEEAAISAAAIVSNFRILDKPEEAGLLKPKSARIYGLFIMAALFLVFVFIYLKEFASTRLKFQSEIEAGSNVPILAEIAYQPNKTDYPIVVEEGKRSLIAEEFRELRTNLNYITFDAKEKGKVILITSSVPNEGKSFVAINTSISLSLTQSKVVLLEFDLRKPKISKELGILKNAGLSTYLIGKASAEEIVQHHPTIANFSIIPSGPIPPNPSELIGNKRLDELFNFLKLHYDYIFIDSPPVGSVTDAKILAKVADATLYIVRQNFTHSSFLQLINDLQQKHVLPNLNIVFNGIKIKKIPGYSYGSGYGSGYKYGYGYGYGYGYTESEKPRPWWKFWL
jgi:capsular exopolysaccharide synthesis family protein